MLSQNPLNDVEVPHGNLFHHPWHRQPWGLISDADDLLIVVSPLGVLWCPWPYHMGGGAETLPAKSHGVQKILVSQQSCTGCQRRAI